MTDINNINSLSIKELQQEISERVELRKQMAGNLYPSILSDEIYAINNRILEIKSKGKMGFISK